MKAVALAVAMCAAVLAPACADPVKERAIDALGPEAPGVPEGPLHRPGQPCLTCHSSYGPGTPQFSLAGTVYQSPTGTVPLANALVKFIDSRGATYETATNCAGNFFVMPADYEPKFPVWVRMVFGNVGGTPVETEMGTPIFRERSCAGCHGMKPSSTSVGPVYMLPEGIPFPPAPCPAP